MYRYKDFSMMDVINVSGKKVGFIKDIIIDFNLGKVIGFQVSPYNLFVKSVSILKEHIVSYDKIMIVKDFSKVSGLLFKGYRNMEVIDNGGNMIGMLEDIIIDSEFNIKGILISSGVVRKLFEGKKVALIKEVIVGEKNILLFKNNEKLNFMSVAHSFIGVKYNE